MSLLQRIIRKLESYSGTGRAALNVERRLFEDRKSIKMNAGQLQAQFNNIRKDIKRLSELEFQVFSQFGDDGIIQWLVHHIPVPNKTFIEFGVENYREANTRFLLLNNQWSGLVIDGSEKQVQEIKGDQVNVFYDLLAVASFITVDNINELISRSKFKPEVGLLSVDIDGNDYWVWKAIDSINPIIVICEYNALFGFEHPYTIEYQHDFVRGKKMPFNFYGTSLRSAAQIAEERGYSFIGCNSAGNNAYFIRNDYMPYLPIQAVSLQDGYEFAKFSEAYSPELNDWVRGADKVKTIDKLPVYNTLTGQVEKADANAIVQSLITANKLTRF
jgi:hypothetical protein